MLYKKYLRKEILFSIALVLVSFLVVFTFFDFIEELRKIGKGNYGLHQALIFEGLKIPGLCYELVPIATLIGTLYALVNLARLSEITILRAAGVSTKELLVTLLSMGSLLVFLTFIFGEVIVPFCENKAQNIKNTALEKIIAQVGFESGLWIKDNNNFINIRRANPNGILEQIRIYKFDDNNRLVSVMDSEQGEFNQQQNLWELKQNTITTLEQHNKAKISKEKTIFWQTNLNPKLLNVMIVAPEKMSLFELLDYRKHLKNNKQKTDRYDIAIWKKITYPFSILVMITLALPFAFMSNRMATGVSLKIFIGVMLGIVFYALNGLFSNLGMIHSWHSFASAATPSIIFLGIALYMLYRVEKI